MRRRGLRDRIRHQRRLTRRLIARHVMARRARPAVRMLSALDAWLGEDEPLTPTRFVPPLVESAEIEPARTPFASDEIDDLDALTSELSDESIDLDAVDLPSAPTAPWPVPELMQPPRPSAPQPRPETLPAPAKPNGDRTASRTIATSPKQAGQPVAHRTAAPRESVQPPPIPPAAPRPAARERQVPIVPRREGIATPRTVPASVSAVEPTAPSAVTRESGATAAQTPVTHTSAQTDPPVAA